MRILLWLVGAAAMLVALVALRRRPQPIPPLEREASEWPGMPQAAPPAEPLRVETINVPEEDEGWSLILGVTTTRDPYNPYVGTTADVLPRATLHQVDGAPKLVVAARSEKLAPRRLELHLEPGAAGAPPRARAFLVTPAAPCALWSDLDLDSLRLERGGCRLNRLEPWTGTLEIAALSFAHGRDQRVRVTLWGEPRDTPEGRELGRVKLHASLRGIESR